VCEVTPSEDGPRGVCPPTGLATRKMVTGARKISEEMTIRKAWTPVLDCLHEESVLEYSEETDVSLVSA